jgi:hypothetical protein
LERARHAALRFLRCCGSKQNEDSAGGTGCDVRGDATEGLNKQMRGKPILPAAIAIVMATATGALAQSMQYDRTGDHMNSYGNAPYPYYNSNQAPVGPTKVHVSRRSPRPATTSLNVPRDPTPDRLFYYGPVAQ